MSFIRFDTTKKIRTVSLDTNVLSDVPYYYMLKQKKKLSKKKKSYYERCCKSIDSIIIILSVKTTPLGINIVKKELKRKPAFLELYNAIFEKQININKEIKYLTKSYIDTGIKAPDALILASASVGKVDLFLSWNRRDIINENNLEIIKNINKRRGVPFPIFATPKEFLERVFLTNRQTICFSQTPIPPGYRLKIF